MVTLRRRNVGLAVLTLVAIGFGLGSWTVIALERGKSPKVEAPIISASFHGVSNTFAQVAAAVKPSVININTRTVVRNPFRGPRGPFEEFFGEEFRRFFGQPPDITQRSLGSGVIVDETGTALTNAHVVEGATEIEVVTADEKKHKAKIVGADKNTDLAVIKIQGNGRFTPVKLGNSDQVNVGDWVLAIGSPFGLSQTVTAGIISAKGRVIGQGPFDDFLQTDAAINPGNSGGPLVNMAGEVIGINSAILSRSGGNVGIGFAIPINVAKKIYAELAVKGKVSRGWLGVSVQELTEDLAKSFNANAGHGVLVADVVDGSPAAKSGVQAGDVIVEFDGKKIESPVDLQRAVGLTQPGTGAKVKLLREKREQTVDVKIAEVPDDLQAKAGRGKDLLGLDVKPVTPELARQLGLRSTEGVVVASVDDGSPAEGAGVQPGDVVREVNRQRVRTVAEFSKAIQGLKAGDRVMLTLQRAGSSLFVAFTIGRG